MVASGGDWCAGNGAMIYQSGLKKFLPSVPITSQLSNQLVHRLTPCGQTHTVWSHWCGRRAVLTEGDCQHQTLDSARSSARVRIFLMHASPLRPRATHATQAAVPDNTETTMSQMMMRERRQTFTCQTSVLTPNIPVITASAYVTPSLAARVNKCLCPSEHFVV